MATVSLQTELPIDRQRLFDYVTHPENWPSFYASVVSVEPGPLSEPGDTVTGKYKLLGKVIDFEAELVDRRDGSLMDLIVRSSVLPDVRQTWRYAGDEGEVRVDVTLTTIETEHWFGRIIDRTVIPGALERDIRTTLDSMGGLIAGGAIAIM